jgi:DNA-binding HxlR family transcriptional regulator
MTIPESLRATPFSPRPRTEVRFLDDADSISALCEGVCGMSSGWVAVGYHRLQQHGLVDRQVYAEAPPRVEYSLTELGQTR